MNAAIKISTLEIIEEDAPPSGTRVLAMQCLACEVSRHIFFTSGHFEGVAKRGKLRFRSLPMEKTKTPKKDKRKEERCFQLNEVGWQATK